MKNLNQFTKNLPKEESELSIQDSSRILAEFFNGLVIDVNEEYIYDS